jgi:NAD(P)-dependent dehydrogenase (short-subunit alcohol dehydrogenase family)
MHLFQVNFFAPIMLARGLIDELQTGSGAVVNVSSIACSRVHPFAGSAYATSKAALAALTREMAADFARAGFASTPSPGEIDTAILSPGTETLIADIPSGGSGSQRRWPKPSISCAPSNRATSTAPSFPSMGGNMCDAPFLVMDLG